MQETLHLSIPQYPTNT